MRAPTFTPATRQGLSVGLATGTYGVSFGALSVAAGLSVWQTCALSLLMFTGGSQFAFVGVVGAGGAGAAAAATATLLGVRNVLYSLQLAPLLKTGRLERGAAAQITIDESAAVAFAQDDPDEIRRGFWVTGLAVFTFWNLTTLAGALLGSSFGDPQQWGLDGAAAAAFLGLLWPRLRDRQAQAVAAAAAVVAAVTIPLAPAGIPVLAAAVAAALVALLARQAGDRPGAGSTSSAAIT